MVREQFPMSRLDDGIAKLLALFEAVSQTLS